MKMLKSIKEIGADDCYQTRGSKPVKVFCNDFNYYICKYHPDTGFPAALFAEYFAASCLQIWKLPVPKFSFVSISREHVKLIAYPFHYFSNTCFGSLFNGECAEVNKLMLKMPFTKPSNETGRTSLLKVGLFDIWLSNEDRHFENCNLLYDIRASHFIPIDHAQCFNGLNIGKEASLISFNESILFSPFLIQFFNRSLQQKFDILRLELFKEFRKNISDCYDQRYQILADTPLDWNSDINFLISGTEHLFSETWIKKCEQHFTEIVYINLNNHRT